MAFKFVILSCILALVRAGTIPVAAPVIAEPIARLEEFDNFPQYRFGYDVADSNTGDFKSQTEQRDGPVVSGQYTVVQPDGTRRVVDYIADDEGFKPVVRNEPLVASAPAVFTEPAVVPARLAAAPVPAAYAAAPVVPARYTAAFPAPLAYPSPAVAAYAAPYAQYAAAPVAYAPAAARYVAF